ncbi:MAG: (d)CMP kinase [Clostridia bacterium]|nr:(d)CMP kinase [Clostridia bacterium]
MIIAIDGVSGSGKTTIAREVAKKLGYGFFSTGLYYRAITYRALQLNVKPTDEIVINALLARTDIKIMTNNQGQNICLLNDVDITQYLNTEEISKNVPQYARQLYIREYVQKLQHDTAKYNKNLVMEGRDIGSVIFPDADLKVYVTCSVQARAQRRTNELLEKGEDVIYIEVLKDLMIRDFEDTHRKHSPLVKCPDAVEIDTSQNNINTCVSLIENALKVANLTKLNKEEKIIAEAMEYFWSKCEEYAPSPALK